MGMWIFREPDTRFFTAEQLAQVAALFEGILPAGADHPGASDVDAAEYLNRLLAMDASTYYEIPAWQKLYAEALPALEAASTSLFGTGLAALKAEQMRALLEQLSQGTLPGMPADMDSKKLFATLRSHCIEGCFADPRWGGNANKVMWRWFGYLEPAHDFSRS